MAFEQKPNNGALFINQKKVSQNHPDMRGDIHLDKTFLIGLMDKSNGPLVKVAISAWNKTSAAGKEYLSLSASEPWEPGATPAAPTPQIPDDEIPY